MQRKLKFYSIIAYIAFSASADRVFSSQSSNHGQQCKYLFFEDPFKAQKITPELNQLFIKTTTKMSESTTGARIEKKWTLDKNELAKILNQFQTTLDSKGLKVELRDIKQPGKKNVTDTVYLEKILSHHTDQDLSLKIRIRKYGTISDQSNDQNIEYAPFTKDHSFVEFKMPDLRFDGAVFKPRTYMKDEYINLFGTDQFIQRYDEILNETIQLNALKYADVETVTSMLQALKKGHEDRVSFKKTSRNYYVRNSYSIKFFDKNTHKNFDVQITIDDGIEMRLIKENKTLKAYSDLDNVIEVKIPTEYANLNLKENLDHIDGFKEFLEFIQAVSRQHNMSFESHRGKSYHAHKEYLRYYNEDL